MSPFVYKIQLTRPGYSHGASLTPSTPRPTTPPIRSTAQHKKLVLSDRVALSSPVRSSSPSHMTLTAQALPFSRVGWGRAQDKERLIHTRNPGRRRPENHTQEGCEGGHHHTCRRHMESPSEKCLQHDYNSRYTHGREIPIMYTRSCLGSAAARLRGANNSTRSTGSSKPTMSCLTCTEVSARPHLGYSC